MTLTNIRQFIQKDKTCLHSNKVSKLLITHHSCAYVSMTVKKNQKRKKQTNKYISHIKDRFDDLFSLGNCLSYVRPF